MENFIAMFNEYFSEYNNVDKQIFLILLSRYSLRYDNDPKDDIIPEHIEIYEFCNNTLFDYVMKKYYCSCKNKLKMYLSSFGYATVHYPFIDMDQIIDLITYLKDNIYGKQDIIKLYRLLIDTISNDTKNDTYKYIMLPDHIIKMLINKVRDNQDKELIYDYCDYCMNETELLFEFNKYLTDNYHSRYFNINYVVLQDLLLNLYDNTYGSKKCKFTDDFEVYDYSFANLMNIDNNLIDNDNHSMTNNNKLELFYEQIRTLKYNNGIGYCIINKSFIDNNKNKVSELLLTKCKVTEIIQLNCNVFKKWIKKEDKYCIISFVKPSKCNKKEYDGIKTKIIDYSNDGYEYDKYGIEKPIKQKEVIINEYVINDISDINKWFK